MGFLPTEVGMMDSFIKVTTPHNRPPVMLGLRLLDKWWFQKMELWMMYHMTLLIGVKIIKRHSLYGFVSEGWFVFIDYFKIMYNDLEIMSEMETRALFVTRCWVSKLVSISDSRRSWFPEHYLKRYSEKSLSRFSSWFCASKSDLTSMKLYCYFLILMRMFWYRNRDWRASLMLSRRQ